MDVATRAFDQLSRNIGDRATDPDQVQTQGPPQRHIVVMGETCYDDCLIITPEEEGLETVSVETLVVPDY